MDDASLDKLGAPEFRQEVDVELIMTLPASTGPLAAVLVVCRNAVRWLFGRP